MGRELHFFHVFPTFDAGGLEVRATQVMHLLGEEVRHTVVAMDNRTGCLSRVPKDVRFELITAPRSKSMMTTPMVMAELFRSRKPDLVLTYNWGSIESIAGAKLAGAEAVIHHEDGFGPEESDTMLLRRVVVRRALLPSVRALVVPSRHLETIALSIWKQPQDRVRYLPNGVDIDRFKPTPKDNDHELVIGHVGRFRPEKNQALLIRLFAEGPLRDTARLLFAGDGPLLEEARTLAKNLGVADRVTFAGAVSDPTEIYDQVDLFVLCSTTEQMPLSVLEAMACGLPVVSTNVGDVAGMVAPENRPFITPQRDDRSLLDAIVALAKDPDRRSRIGAANRTHVEASFPLEGCLRRHAELYLGEARRPRPRGLSSLIGRRPS
jgi:glycosyltransferase involved in cell wall biosynthesis